jgi:hypothetical protein
MHLRSGWGLLRIVLTWLIGAGVGFGIMRLLGISIALSLVVSIFIVTIVLGISIATTSRPDDASGDTARADPNT